MPYGQSRGQGYNNPGVVVATTVIVEGAKGGVFIYSPAPGPGNLIGSWAAQAGTDPFGNAYPQGLAIFNHFLTIQDPAKIVFPSGQTMEGVAANLESNFLGSGAAQFLQMLISGPKGNPVGATDWTQIEFNSSNQGATTDANMQFVYVDIAGTPHLYGAVDSNGFSFTGDGTAADPTQSPTVQESWKTLTLINGYGSGTNNGFIDVPQIRMCIDNKRIGFKGTLATPAAAASTVFAQMPANYPNANLGGIFGMGLVANLSGGTVDHIEIHNNGNISLNNLHNSLNFDISCEVNTQ